MGFRPASLDSGWETRWSTNRLRWIPWLEEAEGGWEGTGEIRRQAEIAAASGIRGSSGRLDQAGRLEMRGETQPGP